MPKSKYKTSYGALHAKRIKDGQRKARAAGKVFGKKPLDSKIAEQIRKLRAEGVTIRGIAEKLGISPATVMKILHRDD